MQSSALHKLLYWIAEVPCAVVGARWALRKVSYISQRRRCWSGGVEVAHDGCS
jgi:hypothetical protein